MNIGKEIKRGRAVPSPETLPEPVRRRTEKSKPLALPPGISPAPNFVPHKNPAEEPLAVPKEKIK